MGDNAAHAGFVSALGARYDGHPGLDHVDIGSVGCWGEWNTACITGPESVIDVYAPQSQAERDAIAGAFETLIDDYVAAFPDTPVVMLGIGSEQNELTSIMAYATQRGTGWRVDCWGDWDMGGAAWSHQDSIYPDMIEHVSALFPGFVDVWQHAPVQLEVCYTMPQWVDRGYSATPPDGEAYRTFQWGLEQHASVLNAKRTDIPDQYVAAFDAMLQRNGYRFVIDAFHHDSTVAAGAYLTLASSWSNLGVAPTYIRRTLAYRLRGPARTVSFDSAADIRTWLPGSWTVSETFTVPADVPAGTYAVEVAILDRAGTDPVWVPLDPIYLGIAGRGTDGLHTRADLIRNTIPLSGKGA